MLGSILVRDNACLCVYLQRAGSAHMAAIGLWEEQARPELVATAPVPIIASWPSNPCRWRQPGQLSR